VNPDIIESDDVKSVSSLSLNKPIWRHNVEGERRNFAATISLYGACPEEILVQRQSHSQSFVPFDQRSENESSGSIHFEITIGNDRILVTRFIVQSQSASMACYGACLKWLLPALSFSNRWSRGTKFWERDNDWYREAMGTRVNPDTIGCV